MHSPDTAALSAVPLFELERVHFDIGARRLLDDISLSIPRECVTGLIGHNGSGKTTLMAMLARHRDPHRGAIRFDGKPIASWKPREFARRVAHLPQYTPSTDGMLVRELVALGRYPWHGSLGAFGERDRERVAAAMEMTDVAQFADRQVDSLSGGERQRVWLAMLIAQDSHCLLLDEPTSALDIAHQIEVLELVRTLCTQRGIAAVIVLHDINMAARFCDRIVALREGKILMHGTPSELLTEANLEAIYGLPMHVLRDPVNGRFVSVPQ
ncbi:ABC transporter ATP-binding protein [Pararobbsia silviterrae]|uniref:ABC transporter ATP-binding protein n=1 Tax=Pararobbsia silviterrae TaxID=1792498 RepID=A0A494Y022_9BURK|nr:ABC transporter ATP-binding protein [Pararobbsia silviterrae]RKP53711.1 ABC transporter ATP-binding protein [Pararobbsia silviterrae]